MTPADAMRRYHAEIERNLYAAEQVCIIGVAQCKNTACPFYCANYFLHPCHLPRLRDLIGDHIEQHDPGALHPIGTCDNGVVVGKEILCKFSGLCRYQSNRVSTSTSPYLNGQPGIYAVCTREAAALALAEQPVNADELPDEIAGRCK